MEQGCDLLEHVFNACAAFASPARHALTRIEQFWSGLRELRRLWVRDFPWLAEEWLDEHLLQWINCLLGISTGYLDELRLLICRIQDWAVASECCARGVSLLHRCGRPRPMVEAHAAGSDMDPSLHAFELPDVWARG